MTVFERLGVADAVRQEGVPLTHMQLFGEGGTLLQSASGRDLELQFGNPIVALHRSRLHAVLLDHVDSENVVVLHSNSVVTPRL